MNTSDNDQQSSGSAYTDDDNSSSDQNDHKDSTGKKTGKTRPAPSTTKKRVRSKKHDKSPQEITLDYNPGKWRTPTIGID